jgi:RNA polymerase sigma-70 factor (ECF subfamily)
LQEQELIQAALAKDAAAERALYEAHVERVYRLAYRMSGDPTLAEDFTQETFVRAFDYLPGFRGQSAFATWLHSIALSVILNGLRKVRRLRGHELGWDEAAETGEAGPDLDLRRRLHQGIAGLPDGLRAVFLMHEVEGFKHEEIAAALGIPAGTSKARLSRAREHLREALAGRAMRVAGREDG